MNCFAHALPFLDRPYYAIGASLPDWLAAADRKCRVREKKAIAWVDDDAPIMAAVAGGVVQHHRDDYWFHTSAVFRDFEMKLAIEVQEIYDGEKTMRPGFVAHVMVEMFIDAWLQKKFTGQLERFYQIVADVDAEKVQAAINRFATQPTEKLVPAMQRFVSERYIFDYMTDEGAAYRMNRVLERIGLGTLDDNILPWAATARQRVYARISALLEGYAMAIDIGPALD